MPEPEGPAATMRRAARQMREQHGPEHVRHEFWSAVADYLENEAVQAPDIGGVYLRGGRTAYALSVARAYLGDPDDRARKPPPCKRIGGCLAEVGARVEDPSPDLWKCSCGRTPRDITRDLAGKEADGGLETRPGQ
jgi:hypothetical protein